MVSLLNLFTLLLPIAAASHLPPPHRRSTHERARKNFEHVHAVEERDSAQNHTIVPRGQTYSGTGTFYYTGLGACGQNSQDSDFMVALNSAQYGSGYPGPQCFKSITVQANGKTVGGVTILDECPTCGYGSLDLSPGLFQQFASFDAGVVSITWWFNDDAPAETTTSQTPTSTWHEPTSTYTPPTSTSTWHEPSTSSTSEWVAPSTSSSPAPSSFSSEAAPSSSTAASSSASSSASSTLTSSAVSSTITSSAIAHNTTNPFVVVSSNGTSTALSGATGSDANGETDEETSTGSQVQLNVNGNLQAFNALAAQYGQIVVVAAEAAL
ncbi:hypothetical protein I317_02050 [Kwoniella heveanensis CBS 569]|nr:hypothetical protein I317_02050 [Kwoniella heveanensis CBS 569]